MTPNLIAEIARLREVLREILAVVEKCGEDTPHLALAQCHDLANEALIGEAPKC